MTDPNFWAILEQGGYSRQKCSAVAQDAGMCLQAVSLAKQEESGLGYEYIQEGFGDKERQLAAERLSALFYAVGGEGHALTPENDLPMMILRRHEPSAGEKLRVYLGRLGLALLGKQPH